MRKVKHTKHSFITKAKQVHGDKYNYSLVEYVNNKTPVKIICPKHGVFEQRPGNHFHGSRCPKCYGNKKHTIETFIDKAKQVHGDKYDYSQVEYKNNQTNVKIVCPVHGMFEQTPGNHFHGFGCGECSGVKKHTIETFIDKAKQVHGDKYDYSLVEYKSNKTSVKIICPVHGVFEQRPDSHFNGRGCPGCDIDVRILSNFDILSSLTVEEDPIIIEDDIHCRCANCRQYFIPIRSAIYNRIRCLAGNQVGEYRLYCSDDCKYSCSIYRRQVHPKGTKVYKNREIQPELRKLVLERDDHQCQKCGSTEDLVCHHFTGVEINPIESADVDNCITLCYNCHQRVHSEKGCNMRREKCK